MYYQRNYQRNSYQTSMNDQSQFNQKNSESTTIHTPSLAMAYVPWQSFENIYSPGEALKNGTIFEDLDKKFCG